jgi:1-pyrroline-5-carboxylate dehydrogenase
MKGLLMSLGRFNIPTPVNEPVRDYAPGSEETKSLLAKVEELRNQVIDIPMIIGGKEIRTGKTRPYSGPSEHKHVLANVHQGGKEEVELAIKTALEAKEKWEKMPWEDRAAIFLRMGELLSGPYRDVLNASTMLGQGKNPHQAEIDAACELIDFFNFNAKYMEEIYTSQPPVSPKGTWNRVEQRPLEGFVFAVTPFNFTSIAGNLPTSVAMMGNVVVWKPAKTQAYSAYFLMKLFEEAGLPPGVINMVFGSASEISDVIFNNENLAGVHFTGSTPVFQSFWKTIGDNITKYKTYPRIVGETGGKDFIVAHPSAEPAVVATAMARGAFEFQGQKCSAASRTYIAKSQWDKIKENFFAQLDEMKMGPVWDFKNFLNPVIDESAFDKISSYIEHAKNADDAEVVYGGEYDKSVGYFIKPTVILTSNPHYKSMEEEIFGPILTVFLYDDEKWSETLELVDNTSPYALTGAIISQDRYAVAEATEKLRHAAGNFYVNDKPTGAVVGQQPFGGSRASGTNDKAGSMINLLRWVSPRAIKENFNPPTHFSYKFHK